MREETFEQIKKVFISIVVISAVIFCIDMCLKEKPILRYYISTDGNSNVAIIADIDNYPDGIIRMSGQNFSRIIEINDSLNLSLKK